MLPQLAIPIPPAARPAPSTPPTIEWVVDTGAPIQVAKLSQRAPASSAAVMSQIKVVVSDTSSGLIIPDLMVPTTLPPAISAPAASQNPANTIAPVRVRAPEPTAGPTLLATSLAPI